MGSVAKGIGSAIGSVAKIASPLIGMLPGGNFINAGIGLLNGGGSAAGNAQSPNLGGYMGAIGQAMGGVQPQGGFMDWLKSNAGGIATAGLLGATIAGGGNPLAGAGKIVNGLIDPRAMNDPRQAATNNFSTMLADHLAKGGSVGDFLQQVAMAPAYGGQLNAGQNAGQTTAVGDANSALAQFFSSGAGAGAADNINAIAGSGNSLNLPPEIAALLGGGSQQNNLMSQIQQIIGSGSNPAISNLLGMNATSPEQSMLQSLAVNGSNPYISQLATAGDGVNAGSAALAGLMNSPEALQLLRGGTGQDLNSIGTAIAGAQQPALDQRLRDLREQFSFNGLRNSTDLNEAAGRATADSQSSLQGILAQIAPQLAQMQNTTSLGALGALSGLGANLGQTEQGSLASRIAALTGASNASNSQLGTLGNILGTSGNLGQGAQGLNIQSQQAGGQLSNSLLSTLTNLFGSNASSGNQQASILAQLFSGQQGNALQAALAQPGATQTLAMLPQLLAGNNLNMNTQIQNQDQGDLTRQYQAWIQQQGNLPLLMQYLSSSGPTQYAPSYANTAANLGLTAVAAKQAK